MSHIAGLTVKPAEMDDLKGAFQAGLKDFQRKPALSLFFGATYAVGGLFILTTLHFYGLIWWIIPFAVGFPLIAPFIAAGLYDISRRLKAGDTFTASDVFSVVWKQQRRELGWMAFVVLFIFWMWMYQIRLLLALFLGKASFSSLDGFYTIVMSTSDGLMFLTVGTIVGAILYTVLFSATVISMPLLLDRDIDFISAMILSFKAVQTSPVIMLGWGFFVAMMTFGAMIPAFLGLLFVLPILGHATWHLCRSLIVEA